ncbi:enoyl-CoA hydratase/isomerase family protein [Acidovorax facilis]|jgi:enoyl-CoA hydratase/carnithine racemase|uniref:enoyl-CoA hydratase/isomerase family protein n=1 Tax=Acidovorax facilis TaxID=12917 RepID=UPI003D64F636
MMLRQDSNQDGIEWITLTNPPVNVVTRALIEQLVAGLRRAADDPGTRVVVLGGEGRHFCAGADLREQQRAWQSDDLGPADLGEALYTALLDFPKPLIGMAHGAVAGAGLSIIACCDFAIAAAGTRISLPEIDVGVLGGISHARAALGKALVHYMALTGLPIEAEKLAHTGLFLEIVHPDSLRDRTAAIARTIADKEPEAARYTKQCMRAIEGLSQLAGYAREHALSKELRASGVTDRLVSQFLQR